MKKFLAFTAAAFLSLTGIAQASTLTLDVLLGPSGSETISVGSALTSNVTLTNISQFSSSLDASVSAGILTVGNGHPGNTFGFAQYTIPTSPVANANIFGFTWLQPSNPNFQIITSDASGGFGPHTISGSQFASFFSGTSPINIVIIDPSAVLKTVQFDSSFGNGTVSGFQATSFVTASNLSSVPLPGTVGLFLIGIAGLYFLRRKAII